MFNGNFYGLIITMLTFVIAVALTVQNVGQTGLHFEIIIRPLPAAGQNEAPREVARAAEIGAQKPRVEMGDPSVRIPGRNRD